VAGAADPAEVTEQFTAATRLLAEGRHAEAARALEAVAETAPDAELADDALLAAAQTLEDHLGDPAGAARLYQQIVDRYPDRRTALAAERRLGSLRRALGPDDRGAEPLARFNEVLQGFPERPEAESIARVEALLAEHPDWSGGARATLWLAEVHQRGDRLDAAARRFAEVIERWPDSEAAFSAWRGAGDVAAAQRRFAEAARFYERMPVAGDPGRREARRDALAGLDRLRLHYRLYQAALVALGLIALGLIASARAGAGSWPATARTLVRPPIDVIYMIPIAALLVWAAYREFATAGPAVAIICAGGLAVTWLSAAALRAGPTGHPRARALAHAAAGALAAIALTYAVLYRIDLIELMLNTLRHGPEP
jgi:hypothetical protein